VRLVKVIGPTVFVLVWAIVPTLFLFVVGRHTVDLHMSAGLAGLVFGVVAALPFIPPRAAAHPGVSAAAREIAVDLRDPSRGWFLMTSGLEGDRYHPCTTLRSADLVYTIHKVHGCNALEAVSFGGSRVLLSETDLAYLWSFAAPHFAPAADQATARLVADIVKARADPVRPTRTA